jgi:nucleoside-diphosphate-sugar epimerase
MAHNQLAMTQTLDAKNRRILVTGASGFIGSQLCNRLRESGGELHAISRTPQPGGDSGLRWWRADLSDPVTVRELLTAVKPDIIFHLASHVEGARDPGLVLPTFRNNLASTVNLLSVAQEVGCQRIVLTSSMEEPEAGQLDTPPSSPYAAAKWAGSAYARMFHALYQLPVVILRVFMVYGPGQRDTRKLVPYVTLALLRGLTPRLTSGVRPVDWIFVGDVVEALLAAARRPGLDGKTVDVGSGQLTQVRTVVDHLVRLIDPQIQPLFGALTERPHEQIRVADTAASKVLMGWGPLISLEEGLQQTVEWFRHRLAEGIPTLLS